MLKAGISDEDLARVFSLGRRGDNTASPRPLLIQMASYAQKNITIELLYKLKPAELRSKSVVVMHDMTKTERDECKRMVNEAKDKEAQDQSGEFIYRVRGLMGKMKIIKIRILIGNRQVKLDDMVPADVIEAIFPVGRLEIFY